MKYRIHLIFISFFLLWSFLIFRTAYVQVSPNGRLEKALKRHYLTTVTIKSRRGSILDKNGEELAVSTVAYSLYADPKMIKNAGDVSRKLGKILQTNWKSIRKKLTKKNTSFVWVQRRISEDLHQQILKLKIAGLGFIDDSRRIYPNGKLLSQTLGFVGTEGDGLEGLELYYNEELRGKKIKVSIPKDARGRPLTLPHEVLVANPNGQDILLTIDKELQFILEQELLDSVKKYSAVSATGVILDAQTSEVLAMANLPNFNPNNPRNIRSKKQLRNRVVTDLFEPGSTLKSLVFAGALNRNLITTSKKYFCENGSWKIGNKTISDADHKFQWLTVSDILSHSSNIGAAKIAFEMGDKNMRQTLVDFGIGQKSGIDFPGEASGLLSHLPWRKLLLSNISFGQGVAVTPLQIANAYAAIANGGMLNQPYLVASIRSSTKKTVFKSKPNPLRRVLTPGQSEKMRMMLLSATGASRTGWRARVPGYLIGGKTGTAQKADTENRGYKRGAYISSFVGFLPAQKPKIVIFVAVDEPTGAYYASQVAAPLFARVASQTVRRLGLSPTEITEEDLVPINLSQKKKKSPEKFLNHADANFVPDLIGLSLRDVYRHLHGTNVNIISQGKGVVTRVSPMPGQPMPKNRRIQVVLGYKQSKIR